MTGNESTWRQLSDVVGALIQSIEPASTSKVQRKPGAAARPR